MTSKEFISKLKEVSEKKTVYMWGSFGSIVTESFISQKVNQYPNNYSTNRRIFLKTLCDGDTWAFDCVGLIKGILWGWYGSKEKSFGGAQYQSNGVPDTTASGMFDRCYDVSTDFTNIVPGEFVFLPGHIGVYIGDGLVCEATLGYGFDGVVITTLETHQWTKHGKSKDIEYVEDEKHVEEFVCPYYQAAHKKLYIYPATEGLYVREELKYENKKPVGKVLKYAPIGQKVEILEFIPGHQGDGYPWVRSRYMGVEGYSQLNTSLDWVVAE